MYGVIDVWCPQYIVSICDLDFFWKLFFIFNSIEMMKEAVYFNDGNDSKNDVVDGACNQIKYVI